jgi:biotin carboxyl carrier protein
MKYYVKVGDQEYEVNLVEQRDGLRGEMNGRVCSVDHAEIEEGAKYSVILDGESFNVSMDLTSSSMDLIVGGHLYHTQVMDERERGALALEQAKDQEGRQVIKSVMPGIVRKIFIKEGMTVEAGKPLIILEAMKMENELCAERRGTVMKVHVTEGQTVNSSDPLVAID